MYQSFLHNRLGGLQVLPPNSDKWFYVEVSASLLSFYSCSPTLIRFQARPWSCDLQHWRYAEHLFRRNPAL